MNFSCFRFAFYLFLIHGEQMFLWKHIGMHLAEYSPPTPPLQHISVNQKGSSFPHWFDFSLQLMVILRDVTFHICSNDLYDNCDNSDVRDDWCGKDNWPAACPTFLLIFWLGGASCWCKGPPSARRDVFIKKNHAHKSLRYAMRGQLDINYIQFCVE